MTRTAISPLLATRTRWNTRRSYARDVEAPFEETEHGLVCKGDGWFLVNARDVRWRESKGRGVSSNFGGDTLFEQLGVGITVVGPNEPTTIYHWESDEEDFLVLRGACIVILD